MYHARRPAAILLTVCSLLAACTAPHASPPGTAPSVAPATVVPAPRPASATEVPPAAPDALTIAYLKEDQAMLWTEGEGARAIGPAGNAEAVRLSDDGRVVALLALGGGTLLTALYADGAPPRVLLGPEALQATGAGAIADCGFLPGSHALVVVTDAYDLRRIDADTGESQTLLAAGSGGFFTASPDGSWLSAYHPNEIVVARADGSGAHTAFTFPEDYTFAMMGPEIVWADDASGFTVASPTGTAAQLEPGAMAVWFVPVEGEAVQQFAYAGTYGAALSPDGRAVVYQDYRQDPGDIHVVAADGSDVLYDPCPARDCPFVRFMGWAPDSTHFLLDLSEDGRLEVPCLATAGEEPARLTEVPAAGAVRWVDGGRVVFVGYGTGDGQALYLQAPGEPPARLDGTWSFAYDVALPAGR